VSPPVDPNRFRQLLSRFATGVTVVTALDPAGRPAGMTASALASVSLEPPLILVCVGKQAAFHAAMSAARHFAVNVLAADQEHLSRQFAAIEGDHFAGVTYRPGANGVPLLEGAVAHLLCEVTERHEAGDHTVFFGLVAGGETFERVPLLYFKSGYTAPRDAR
jgi:3-hydroxy-9,10-secoandrosta-1,3,5(10)-triene-9,17-dione monooxygenase reductase component